ncbi:bifunctional 2-polyprenyl-6-hydroxyphenol methylase/3-demethylubiquinol 3-O-methyltransferase UbiG [Plantactinospora sp. KBS50]|uniref:class I SAM-dependent methyltransferase n=1 Tax=Plantactinospora sp. KBS50 TaxID=2024580 RepID=UPI000BAAC0E2|nr:class I SAM-dependent methyltransferase [Plantactinospora sp. KBS50]ASW53905.1 hypothetical protein CIK06_06510 [Plantactinospora sp. KBS50]
MIGGPPAVRPPEPRIGAPGRRRDLAGTGTAAGTAAGTPAGTADPDRTGFAAALVPGAGSGRHWLVQADGRWLPLPVRRWHGPAEPALHRVVDLCTGPTLDVGCGPGRATEAVARRGVPALGVDTCATAVRLTRERGGSALRRDVFDALPGEGRWAHVLLLDGNIGIGGEPAALLRRCAALLRTGGTALVEAEAPDTGGWSGLARLAYQPGRRGLIRRSPEFRWARLAVDQVHRYAPAGALAVRRVLPVDGRWFVELVRG